MAPAVGHTVILSNMHPPTIYTLMYLVLLGYMLFMGCRVIYNSHCYLDLFLDPCYLEISSSYKKYLLRNSKNRNFNKHVVIILSAKLLVNHCVYISSRITLNIVLAISYDGNDVICDFLD